MEYNNCIYDTLAKPNKITKVAGRRIFINGARLAGLATAAFLIRDGLIPGKNIHIYDPTSYAGGGSPSGIRQAGGFMIRNDKFREKHFDCFFDLFSGIPSLRKDTSVYEEIYNYNLNHFSTNKIRFLRRQGEIINTNYPLNDKSIWLLLKLIYKTEDEFINLSIEDYFDDYFFRSTFWTLFATIFYFRKEYSLIEMRRYLRRYMHILPSLNDGSYRLIEPYNGYQTYIAPLIKYLKEKGVTFYPDTTIEDLKIGKENGKNYIDELVISGPTGFKTVYLNTNDLVFLNIGSYLSDTATGAHFKPVDKNIKRKNSPWQLWQKISSFSSLYGNPNAFLKEENYFSATITLKDDSFDEQLAKIFRLEKLNNDFRTAGPILIKDSPWQLSFNINKQPIYPLQRKEEKIIYLSSNKPSSIGSYMKFSMDECNGADITAEWLYHLGFDEHWIDDLAIKHAKTIPAFMPYAHSTNYVHSKEDRPEVVPEDALNFGFIGNYVEIEDECAYSDEYGVRSAMIAVYKLLDINRPIPPIYLPCYDMRCCLDVIAEMLGKHRHIDNLNLSFKERLALGAALKIIKGSELERQMKDKGIL